MKFGVREICDVVLKAKTAQKIGNKIFYAGEPVCYFDTLKTSALEGAATTVYAQGGRGNARLMAWEGERTVTFTMEDALMSPEGFMILSGAGLVEATSDKPIYQHCTEIIDKNDVEIGANTLTIKTSEVPYLPTDNKDNFAYVMLMYRGEIVSEPYIPEHDSKNNDAVLKIIATHDVYDAHEINTIGEIGGDGSVHPYTVHPADNGPYKDVNFDDAVFDAVLVDYYVARESNASLIEITADKFGGNFYLEASTLFRDQNGIDMPAEFIIPNCKVQSNFTFTMASSGDPSSFTFTMDAFPDYTRFDKSKKVLAAVQIFKENAGLATLHRHSTTHEAAHDKLFM